ncbi:hypothetical protein COX84_06495 [Candidatus Micrarchaeota archaeon CG_4_10_14_0_2_um_filter_49_7]|nr:MAG: hypothetical protein COX84_06495 [Candidatus Micrarchaeota archaeon CG_4_10_14_0_2_um_filter_49_7]
MQKLFSFGKYALILSVFALVLLAGCTSESIASLWCTKNVVKPVIQTYLDQTGAQVEGDFEVAGVENYNGALTCKLEGYIISNNVRIPGTAYVDESLTRAWVITNQGIEYCLTATGLCEGTAPRLVGTPAPEDTLPAEDETETQSTPDDTLPADAIDDEIGEQSDSNDNDAQPALNVQQGDIVTNFTARWDTSQENKLQFSWKHTPQDKPYYLVLNLWTTGNSGPLPSVESTIQELKTYGTDGLMGSGISYVYSYDSDNGNLYYGGNFAYPFVFRIHASLLNQTFDKVGEIPPVSLTLPEADKNASSVPLNE